MTYIKGLHHVAIICSDYNASKKFYTEALGLTIKAEHYRKERDSWKLDLAIGDQYIIELFSFPSPPKRVSRPEASGLRHLAFAVENLDKSIENLKRFNVVAEAVRVDEFTGKRFTFFEDPDHLPLELYEL